MIRILKKEGRWTSLVTFADESQGHTGIIYKATNWHYVGSTKFHPLWIDSLGRHVARKSGPTSRKTAEMKALGYYQVGKYRKHKYVLHF